MLWVTIGATVSGLGLSAMRITFVVAYILNSKPFVIICTTRPRKKALPYGHAVVGCLFSLFCWRAVLLFCVVVVFSFSKIL